MSDTRPALFRRALFKITHPFVRLFWRLFKPRTIGVKALVIHDDAILLVKNINIDQWSLPGGGVNRKEIAEEALLRELDEELAVANPEIAFKLGEYDSEREGKRDTVHLFVVKTSSREYRKQWELDDARWFFLGDLPGQLSPASRRRIIEFQAGKKNVVSGW